jgi:glucose/arabinose dehydrogenase
VALSATLLAVTAAAVLSAATLTEANASSPTPITLQPFLEDLEFPSNMAFAPDGRLFFNEKDTGNIRIVRDGEVLPDPFFHVDVNGGGESGLLGLALDPHFDADPWVYVYFTSATDGRNHLQRIRADGDHGTTVEHLITLLQASGIHNGGDITFGPDGKLYVVTGETGDSELSQNLDSLGGKVLRLNPDGSIPDDNPFGDSPVYSLGHRNSFGLCFNPANGDLWETENGPDQFDEINRIEAGQNYGWPEALGPEGAPKFEEPVLAFRAVIVVTGCAFAGNVLFFGDFHQDLHVATLEQPQQHNVTSERTVAHLPAGITDLEVGPDGLLYVATGVDIERAAIGSIPAPSVSPQSPVPTPTGGDGVSTLGLVLAAIGLVAVVWLVVALGARLRRRAS